MAAAASNRSSISITDKIAARSETTLPLAQRRHPSYPSSGFSYFTATSPPLSLHPHPHLLEVPDVFFSSSLLTATMRLAAIVHVVSLFILAVVALPNAAPSQIYRRSPAPSGVYRRAPAPSGVYRRAPAPSGVYRRAPAPSLAARSPKPSAGLSKRAVQETLVNPATLLCPYKQTACPIDSESSPTTLQEWMDKGFECVDFKEDLTSCGGCGITDAKHDCTAIEGSDGVSCVVGNCRVDSCLEGFTRSLDGKSCVRSA